MLVRDKYGISLISFTGFLAVYILIYSTVPVEGLLPPSEVKPNPTRPPHGCYNYGLCTNPKQKTITSPPDTVVWDCTHTDCVCVAGTEDGNYTCSSIYNYCKNNTCAGTCTQELGDSTWKCNCPSGYQGPNCTKTYAIWVSTNEENLGCFNYDGGVLDSNCKKISSPMNTIDYCKKQQMTTMDPFYYRFAISGQNCYLCNNTFTLSQVGGNPKNDWRCTQQCPGNGGQSCGRDNERVWIYRNINYIWDPDQCASINGTNPCSQGTGQGICIDDEGAYSCRCHPKYTGSDCETPVDDPCLVAPCLNNGTCIADPNTLNYKTNTEQIANTKNNVRTRPVTTWAPATKRTMALRDAFA
ncbi:hypothetical protein WR25_06326 [Diploscapter pachys]|uniref:EGF-like domain-containing protein n=1 Tax=Diploscapter pachys TaxID=2018661 RepID=A0A2A2JF28_9BILA|nr:hypothetical protein WR25_06326 [Diploscapter pachys]